MHLSYMHPVTLENQFHCTRLYSYSTFVYYGSLKIKAAQNLLLGSNRQESRSKSWGVWYWLVLSRSFTREFFGANVTSSWRHSFRAIWPGQRKSCVRDVTCLSLPSMAEGMPAFRRAVWQCVDGRYAAGNYSRLAKGRNRQQFFRQVIRSFQRGKWTKPSSENFYFHAHNFCYTLHILKPNTFSESRCIIGSAEALPILCVSDFCEREKERERRLWRQSISRWNRE